MAQISPSDTNGPDWAFYENRKRVKLPWRRRLREMAALAKEHNDVRYLESLRHLWSAYLEREKYGRVDITEEAMRAVPADVQAGQGESAQVQEMC